MPGNHSSGQRTGVRKKARAINPESTGPAGPAISTETGEVFEAKAPRPAKPITKRQRIHRQNAATFYFTALSSIRRLKTGDVVKLLNLPRLSEVDRRACGVVLKERANRQKQKTPQA